MKISLWRLLTYFHWECCERNLNFSCCLFSIEICEWSKAYQYDELEFGYRFYFWPNWPLEAYFTKDEIYKYSFINITRGISQRLVFMHQLPWHYFLRKYLSPDGTRLMITKEI